MNLELSHSSVVALGVVVACLLLSGLVGLTVGLLVRHAERQVEAHRHRTASLRRRGVHTTRIDLRPVHPSARRFR